MVVAVAVVVVVTFVVGCKGVLVGTDHRHSINRCIIRRL